MKTIVAAVLLGYTLLDVCGAASLPETGNERHYVKPRDLDSFSLHFLVTRDDNNGSWIDRYKIPLAAGIGGGGLLVILLIVIIVIISCCVYRRKKQRTRNKYERKPLMANGSGPRYNQQRPHAREPGVAEAMNRQRKEKEMQEKQKANDTVQYFLRNNAEYKYDSGLGDLGSRMQKHWFKVAFEEKDQPKKILLLTTTPVSQKCPLKLEKDTLKGINKLMRELRKHPLLQPVMMVDYLASHQQLVVVQPFQKNGSLKDIIYRATPCTDWSNKYSRRSKGLKIDTVRLYGRQILEAMVFLYERGFPTLGHVQSGNVFVVNDSCLLGGYENTLLGYKTRLYRLCKEHHERLDVIMFGHLVFEMCCGYELTHLSPGDSDYKAIGSDEEKEILHYIFENDFPHEIRQIKDKEFFSVTLSQLQEFDPDTVKTSAHRSIESVLDKVRKGKPRHQKVPKQKKDEDVTPTPTPAPSTAPPTTPQAAPPPSQDTDKTPVPNGKVGATADAHDNSGKSKTGKQNGIKKILGGGKKKELAGSGGEDVPVCAPDDKTPIPKPLEENV